VGKSVTRGRPKKTSPSTGRTRGLRNRRRGGLLPLGAITKHKSKRCELKDPHRNEGHGEKLRPGFKRKAKELTVGATPQGGGKHARKKKKKK